MFARFIVPVERKSLLKIPLKYVTEVGQLNIVYVYVAGKLERRYVRLGPDESGMAVVLSGLNEGDRLVIPVTTNP
jgi:multidrug efflux pump subunit AcrA (membrane-fusion protein)